MYKQSEVSSDYGKQKQSIKMSEAKRTGENGKSRCQELLVARPLVGGFWPVEPAVQEFEGAYTVDGMRADEPFDLGAFG